MVSRESKRIPSAGFTTPCGPSPSWPSPPSTRNVGILRKASPSPGSIDSQKNSSLRNRFQGQPAMCVLHFDPSRVPKQPTSTRHPSAPPRPAECIYSTMLPLPPIYVYVYVCVYERCVWTVFTSTRSLAYTPNV